ncbi:hypothetical protein EDD90_2480 [Streptomyces sp. Ag109_O5-1]|nr:hypothetical protein EDD90_2480 [Streptomyces sp. Ag109_O5-1]
MFTAVNVTLRTRAGALQGWAIRHENGGLEGWFAAGPVDLRAPVAGEHENVLPALGVAGRERGSPPGCSEGSRTGTCSEAVEDDGQHPVPYLLLRAGA